MKNSRLRFARSILFLLTTFFIGSTIIAQTSTCVDERFTLGSSLSTPGSHSNFFCNAIPLDVVFWHNQSFEVTCRGCVNEGSSTLPHNIAWIKGGSTTCTNFSKEMVIDFSQPAAEVELGLSGARTLTDNRGVVHHTDGTSQRVKFEGPGITRITLSDPVESDSPSCPGCWEIEVSFGTFGSDANFYQCNCNRPTLARPAPESAFSPDWNGNYIPDWRMDVVVSDDDGLVLKNIRLENRYMAEQISVPYYFLETNSINPAQRGELKPDSSDPSMASRLVNYNVWHDDQKLVVEATYVVGQIPAGSTNCLEIIQRYEFYKSKPGDNCEPSASLPCARWKPIVSYKFRGPAAEFHNIKIAQRDHFRENGFERHSVGLFRDCDNSPLSPSLPPFFGCLPLRGLLFADKINPLPAEYGSEVIRNGQDAGKWDNFHQTFMTSVDEPLINPGCPECVHLHWRWGAHLGEAFGYGKALIAEGSTQDVDIAIVAFHEPGGPNPEDDPSDYSDLFASPEPTWGFVQVPGLSTYINTSKDLVFWYSSTGHSPQDTFFPTKGGFFNPSYQGVSRPIIESLPPIGEQGSSKTKTSKSAPASPSSGDHPESITFADLYETGDTTFTTVDPSTLEPLPNGYLVYDADVYDVATEATVSGPHVVTFSVPSVNVQSTFDTLRVLHVEPDSFDPAKLRLIDRTVLAPQSPAPDFANRKVSAKVDGLGIFLLATYTPQPPNTDLADLVVTVSDTPDAVVASNNLTYTVNVTNNGPQTANEVMLKDSLAPEAKFVSVAANQGTCREVDGSVLCSLDSMAANTSAAITIVVTPNDGGTPFPPTGKTIRNVALIKANEGDTNLANNSFIESTTVLPDPNAGPTINLTSPTTGTALVGPANLTISATASDADGSVSGVNVYENGNLLGSATLVGTNEYAFSWNNISFGSHILAAIATDNLGKQTASDPVTIIVNGSAAISVTSPANWAVINSPANITITANASLSGGTITKVDFYEDGVALGTGTLTGGTQYSFTRNAASAGLHVLRAVATDSNGISTTSIPVNVVVNDPPVISLLAPANGAVYSTAPANVTVTANASDWDGGIWKVDFYANGLFIGTNGTHGVNQFNLSWTNVGSGTYSLTAVARDIYGAVKTSAPISVRVNAPPVTVEVLSPENGVQFTTPANITLIATASDSDGTISNVDFFANNYRLGAGTPIGNNKFSFTWNGPGVGSYNVAVTATDNDGASTESSRPLIKVSSPALLVAGSTTLNSSDAAIKARMEALNNVVTVKDAASVTTADANGKALVVISSTVTPASVGTKFRTVTVPVITWESGLFFNMGMTGSGNKDFGTKTNQTQISITNPTHPLAAGLSGNVTVVTSSGTFDWGKPNTNASSVGTAVGDAAKTLIFGYEQGVAMPGLTAPARRVGLFMFDTTAAAFNANGTALLDAAIKWARGNGSLSATVTVSPPASVDLTAQGVVDWAHWALNGAPNFDHKSNVTQQISNFTKIGTPSPGWFIGSPTTFNWTNGTPTVSASTQGGLVTGSTGNGYEITVPADTNVKTLKLYVGAWYGQARLEASLSDGSAATFVNTSINACGGGAAYGVYTINFKADSVGQTLKVRYTLLSDCFAPNGKVALQSATLQ